MYVFFGKHVHVSPKTFRYFFLKCYNFLQPFNVLPLIVLYRKKK